MGPGDPIHLTTGGKGTWPGIRLHERTASIGWFKDPEIHVEDCDHPEGIFWSEHPEANGPELFGYIVQDTGEVSNGDGTLDPGETVQLVLDIHNWTRMLHRVILSTNDPFVSSSDETGSSVTSVLSRTVIPGRTECSTHFFTVASDYPPGHRISFNVEFMEFRGDNAWTETFSLTVNRSKMEHSAALPTAIEESDRFDEIPSSFALTQNYPNPFNAETVIPFDLPHAADVALTIFNATGQVVRQWEGSWTAGHHHLTWNGDDERGNPVASGVYVYRLEAGGYVETRRMTLIR